jgi:hypothetical protein
MCSVLRCVVRISLGMIWYIAGQLQLQGAKKCLMSFCGFSTDHERSCGPPGSKSKSFQSASIIARLAKACENNLHLGAGGTTFADVFKYACDVRPGPGCGRTGMATDREVRHPCRPRDGETADFRSDEGYGVLLTPKTPLLGGSSPSGDIPGTISASEDDKANLCLPRLAIFSIVPSVTRTYCRTLSGSTKGAPTDAFLHKKQITDRFRRSHAKLN